MGIGTQQRLFGRILDAMRLHPILTGMAAFCTGGLMIVFIIGVRQPAETMYAGMAADTYLQLEEQAQQSRLRQQKLRERWKLLKIVAAEKAGINVGSSGEAHGLKWQVTNVHDQSWPMGLCVNIRISGELQESNLKALLTDLEREAREHVKKFSPFRIFMYASEEDEANRGDVAWLNRINPGDKPSITVNPYILRGLTTPHIKKFGLSHVRRQEIYRAYWAAMRRGEQEIEQQYPTTLIFSARSDEERRAFLEAQYDALDSLTDKYLEDVARNYGLSVKLLNEIWVEGFEHGWPAR